MKTAILDLTRLPRGLRSGSGTITSASLFHYLIVKNIGMLRMCVIFP